VPADSAIDVLEQPVTLHIFEMIGGLSAGHLASLSVGGGHEVTLVVPLILLHPRAVSATLAGALIVLRLALGTVKDRPDRLLARGVVHRNVNDLLGGSRALAPQFVNQGIAGGPAQESPNHVGIDDVGKRVALLGEAPNVLAESFPWLLPAVLEIPWVSGVFISALEVSHEDFPRSDQPRIQSAGRCSSHVCDKSARDKGKL
jgi:hypothetical protein